MQPDRQVTGVQIHYQGALLVYVWYVYLCDKNVGDGSVKVPGLHDDNKPTPAMVGALGLAAASVSTVHCAVDFF